MKIALGSESKILLDIVSDVFDSSEIDIYGIAQPKFRKLVEAGEIKSAVNDMCYQAFIQDPSTELVIALESGLMMDVDKFVEKTYIMFLFHPKNQSDRLFKLDAWSEGIRILPEWVKAVRNAKDKMYQQVIYDSFSDIGDRISYLTKGEKTYESVVRELVVKLRDKLKA